MVGHRTRVRVQMYLTRKKNLKKKKTTQLNLVKLFCMFVCCCCELFLALYSEGEHY